MRIRYAYFKSATFRQRGATAVEYALLAALIAAAIATVVGTLGGHVADLFTDPELLNAFDTSSAS